MMFACNPFFTHLKTIALPWIRVNLQICIINKVGFKEVSFEYLPFGSNKSEEFGGGGKGIQIYLGVYPFVYEVMMMISLKLV
jgi:hypothetical protein